MTERPRKVTPRRSPAELRLYAVTLLAAVYVVSWRAIGAMSGDDMSPAISPRDAGTSGAPAASPTHAVWLDEVPLANRPTLAPPAGWQVVSRDTVMTRPALAPPMVTPAIRTVPPPARRRVRTRSS